MIDIIDFKSYDNINKKFNLNNIIFSDKFVYKKKKNRINYIIKEINLYKNLYKYNIGPNIYEVYINKNNYIIKFERFDKDLYEYIKNDMKINEFDNIFIKLKDIIIKICDIELFSTDIKLKNFLIKDNNIVLTDIDFIDHKFDKNSFIFIIMLVITAEILYSKILYKSLIIDNINKIVNIRLNINKILQDLYDKTSYKIDNSVIYTDSTYNFKQSFQYIRYFIIYRNKYEEYQSLVNGLCIYYQKIENIKILIDEYIKIIGLKNKKLKIIDQGTNGVIYDYNDYRRIHKLDKNNILFQSQPTNKELPTLLSRIRVIQKPEYVIKESKNYETIENIETEFNIYNELYNNGIGIKVYDVHKIESYNDKFKYAIRMDKYDGNLLDYFIKNINLISIEYKINTIIDNIIYSNYLCGDIKFKNILYRTNNNILEIKLTDFDSYYCKKNNYDHNFNSNFLLLLKLTLCTEHIKYILNQYIDIDNIIIDLFNDNTVEINLKLLFYEIISKIDNIDIDSKWLINIFKYINNFNNLFINKEFDIIQNAIINIKKF